MPAAGSSPSSFARSPVPGLPAAHARRGRRAPGPRLVVPPRRHQADHRQGPRGGVQRAAASTSSSAPGSPTSTPAAARSASRPCPRRGPLHVRRARPRRRRGRRREHGHARAARPGPSDPRRRHRQGADLDAELVFADPPYGFADWPRLLRAVPAPSSSSPRPPTPSPPRRTGSRAGQALRPDLDDVPRTGDGAARTDGHRVHYFVGTHAHRAQPRELRPDPPRPRRRRRAGRRAVRPRHGRRHVQPREDRRAVHHRRARRADPSRAREAGLADHVAVVAHAGLAVDAATAAGAAFIVKGLRSAADFEIEQQMALTNHSVTGVRTVYLPCRADRGFISSRFVREIARYGGAVGHMVPRRWPPPWPASSRRRDDPA